MLRPYGRTDRLAWWANARSGAGVVEPDLGPAASDHESLRSTAEVDQENTQGREGTKRYDAPATPYQRALDDSTVTKAHKARLNRENKPLNPAQIQREIRALTAQLLTLTTAKRAARQRPSTRAHFPMSPRRVLRAHLDMIPRGACCRVTQRANISLAQPRRPRSSPRRRTAWRTRRRPPRTSRGRC